MGPALVEIQPNQPEACSNNLDAMIERLTRLARELWAQ